MSDKNKNRKEFTEYATKYLLERNHTGNLKISRQTILNICADQNFAYPSWLVNDEKYKTGIKGRYYLPEESEWNTLDAKKERKTRTPSATSKAKFSKAKVKFAKPNLKVVPTLEVGTEEVEQDNVPVVEQKAPTKMLINKHHESMIPKRNPLFQKFGDFDEIKHIVSQGQFFFQWIAGLTGNGKTEMVEQACAELKRELWVIPITVKTDEDSLFGGYRLIDGNTVWFDGPLTRAMEAGGVALLDELDTGDPENLVCLHAVLSGKPHLISHENKWVHPAPGFMVIATGNTCGKGDDTGQYIGTHTQNEAFLDRINSLIEHDYPPIGVERTILRKKFESYGLEDDKYIELLVRWGSICRKTQKEGGFHEAISTRRLLQIVTNYALMDNKELALKRSIGRFDTQTQKHLMTLWNSINDAVEAEEKERIAKEQAAMAPANDPAFAPETSVADILNSLNNQPPF